MTSSRLNAVTTKQPRSAAILLITTIADTTWRVFVPTVGGILIGVWLNQVFNVGLAWSIILFVIGSLISVVLVKMQLKRVNG